jgi:hypothetical protein
MYTNSNSPNQDRSRGDSARNNPRLRHLAARLHACGLRAAQALYSAHLHAVRKRQTTARAIAELTTANDDLRDFMEKLPDVTDTPGDGGVKATVWRIKELRKMRGKYASEEIDYHLNRLLAVLP